MENFNDTCYGFIICRRKILYTKSQFLGDRGPARLLDLV